MPKVSKNSLMTGDSKLGLVCRNCGCQHFRVIYLRRLIGVVVRCRECRHCGKRLRTRETIA